MVFTKEKLFEDFEVYSKNHPVFLLQPVQPMFHPNVNIFCADNLDSSQDYLTQFLKMHFNCGNFTEVIELPGTGKCVVTGLAISKPCCLATITFVDESDGCIDIHTLVIKWYRRYKRIEEMLYDAAPITVDKYVELCNELVNYYPRLEEWYDYHRRKVVGIE